METHLQKFLAAVKAERAAAKSLDGEHYGSKAWVEAQRDHKACQDRVDFLVAGWPEAELEAPPSPNELGDYNSEDAWIQTFTGLDVYPLNPDITKISLVDCAHSLSILNRYNGHSLLSVNVAWHSLLVSLNVSPENALAGLMHDAPEYILGDILRPIKRTPLFAPYRKLEEKWLELFGMKCGFKTPLDEEVKLVDNGALLYERDVYMAAAPKQWREYPHKPIHAIPDANPFDSKACEVAFLRRFSQLTGF